jgi:hypothetical protein
MFPSTATATIICHERQNSQRESTINKIRVYQYGTPPYCNSRWYHHTRLEGGGYFVFAKADLLTTFLSLVTAAAMSG